MYTILVIITSKWKIMTLLVFEKTSFERWEVYYVGCQGLRHKSATVWLVNYNFLFPTTLDRLRMSSQVFSNKFIAVWLLTKILTCTVCRNTWHPTYFFYFFYFLTTKSTKFHPFCHSDILVQVTDTLESQFWGICFFSWHSTKKTTKRVEHQHYSKVWQCHKCDLPVQ